MVCAGVAEPNPPLTSPKSTRGFPTETGDVQDTTASRAASAPNWVCSPVTGGAPAVFAEGSSSGELEAHPPAPRATAPTPTPAPAASSERRDRIGPTMLLMLLRPDERATTSR